MNCIFIVMLPFFLIMCEVLSSFPVEIQFQQKFLPMNFISLCPFQTANREKLLTAAPSSYLVQWMITFCSVHCYVVSSSIIHEVCANLFQSQRHVPCACNCVVLFLHLYMSVSYQNDQSGCSLIYQYIQTLFF